MPDPLDIVPFLADGRWKARFDDEILTVAHALAKKSGVPRMEESSAAVSLLGEVAGEEVEVNLWPVGDSFDLETSCSCEVGVFCHHAAALLLRMAQEKRPWRRVGRTVAEAVAATLPGAREPVGEPPPELPRLAYEPRFELRVSREAADPSLRLLLRSLGQPEPDSWISAEAAVVYGPYRRGLRSAAPDWVSPVTRENGQPAILQHDAAAEAAAVQQLRDAGLSSPQSNQAWRYLLHLKSRKQDGSAFSDRWFPDPERVPIDAFWYQFRGEMAARLQELGWSVTTEDSMGHRVHDADPEKWEAELLPGTAGWFSLSVGFEVAGERYDLLPILANLLEGDFLEETLDRPDNGFVYAPLPNGDALRLPIGRVRRILRHLESLMDPKFPGNVRLHALDAVSLAGLGELGCAVPPDFGRMEAKLRTFSGMDAVAPAEGVRAVLRDYQLEGFRWMQFLARHGLHGVLADDMGLGKTLQTLTHILTEKESGRSQGLPALVVSPTSVVPNWRAEALKFTPGLRVLVLNGPERKKYFRSIPHADLVLTSYALLQRDIEKLRGIGFHLAVLDEAQHIKNPRSKVAQAACKLDARHRLCLSGTPIENHLGELWSLMRFLVPGFLGTEEMFQQRFRKPIEKEGDVERNALLKQRVAPLILRRTKDQVAKELPPKTELVHLIELHTEQKDLYETVRATMDKRVRQAIAARGAEQSQIVFLDALLKLRQICCDPRLLPEDFSHEVQVSAKLDFLIELLAVLIEEGRKILLFSQFTAMLSLIEQHLVREGIPYLKLTGSSRDRGQLVEDFQKGKAPLFLISLKAGGTGLNLTAADTVIHYDPWWNPAAEAQATDRAYRIGQDKPVFVHKLLCQETVEERIHKLQQEKAKLAAGLLSGADVAARMDAETVRALLEK